MKFHFIAIGGAVMHNLAIVLKRRGEIVTGSDDKIADPAKTNLEREGILPKRMGFYADNISPDIDAVILGMHARADNPELLRAQESGIKIYSFPEYLYEFASKKQRVVIAGSHGKTTITAMVMHVLKECNFNFDYLVGAAVKGFDTSVKLSDAPVIVLEGDEYLASAIERQPKFLFYKPHVALLSGIAWDHINVFPEYEGYVEQFKKFAYSMDEWGFLTWFGEDEELKKIFNTYDAKVRTRPYYAHPRRKNGNSTLLQTEFGDIPIKIFGEHNMQNIAGAKNVCSELGVFDEDFYRAISTFEGAANRLQFAGGNNNTVIYRDFAHSPSKVKATVKAMKEQFGDSGLAAVLELHTFSSLNREFLAQYAGSMDEATVPVIFLDKETFESKKMPMLEPEFIMEAFANRHLHIFTSPAALRDFLLSQRWKNNNLLLMSSGNFGGLDVQGLVDGILKNNNIKQ